MAFKALKKDYEKPWQIIVEFNMHENLLQSSPTGGNLPPNPNDDDDDELGSRLLNILY